MLLAEQHQTWGFWTMHHRLRNLGFGWKSKIRRSQSQAGLQDLQIDDTESEKQAEETASGKGKRTFASTYLSQCNVEYGLYARHFGEW